jgi:conjugal transfer pilus assembly protein TraV
MKKILFAVAIASSTLMTTGCVNSIGEEDFTCPHLKKGGVCGGPRDVYELTNNRENLENLSQEDLAAYYAKKHGDTHAHPGASTSPNHPMVYGAEANDEEYVYEERSLDRQQTPENYERAKPLPQIRGEVAGTDSFEQWPSNGEPLAPEGMAVLQPAEVMRVLVAAYTDDNGYANMPGFVFVEVTPRQWTFGEAANMRPTRVVPLEMRQQSQEQMRRTQSRSQGVDPLGVVNPMSRN